jgi:hypothetical protein
MQENYTGEGEELDVKVLHLLHLQQQQQLLKLKVLFYNA